MVTIIRLNLSLNYFIYFQSIYCAVFLVPTQEYGNQRFCNNLALHGSSYFSISPTSISIYNMDILDLIEEADKKSSFENHPMKHKSLEEQILYLNGLCLPIISDGDISNKQKDYLKLLINSFNLDRSCLNDILGFAQEPDKETIKAFLDTFRRKLVAQAFLFDSYMIALREDDNRAQKIAVINKLADKLEVMKGVQGDIFDLFCSLKNKDWDECSLFSDYVLLNNDNYAHILEYYDVNPEDFRKNNAEKQQSLLLKKIGIDVTWIPLKYKKDAKKPEAKYITKDFIKIFITNEMATLLLQNLSNRKQLKIEDGKAYQLKTNNASLFFDLNNSEIQYDYLNREFFTPADCESNECKGTEKQFIFYLCNLLGFNPKAIAEARPGSNSFFTTSGERLYLPKNQFGKFNKDEIFRTKNGNFFQNIEGEGDLLVSKRHRVSGDFASILCSGKIRFTK